MSDKVQSGKLTLQIVAGLAIFCAGIIVGVAWQVALLPIGLVSVFIYDLSRFGFALSAAICLFGLRYQFWRQWGLGIFVVGFCVGSIGSAVFYSLGNRPVIGLIYVFPISIIVIISLLYAFAKFISSFVNDESQPIAKTPRKFGLFTIASVVVAFSFALALANFLQIPATVTGIILGFLSFISIMQLFIQKDPRGASVLGGAIIAPVSVIALWIAFDVGSSRFGPLVGTVADFVFLTAHAICVGAAIGYIAGTLVGGLFMAIENLTRFQKRKPA